MRKLIFISALLFDSYWIANPWLFYLLSFINYPLHIPSSSNFWPFPRAWGLAILCCSSRLAYKKSKAASYASPSILSQKNHYFSVLRSVEKMSCSGEQRKKKCQCLRKKSSLIESESTSASSWMSKGVIGDWLQIMNNYIKDCRRPVHVYVWLFLCMCSRAGLCFCILAGAEVYVSCVSLSMCVYVCVCVRFCLGVGGLMCAGNVLNEEKPAGAFSNSLPAPVSWIQSVLRRLLLSQ